jgi:biopolymer transport protein ExbD
MRKNQRFKKIEKLNLVPILDSVFIFIFFLLSSAQFIEIREISTSTPAIKTIKSTDKNEPLNLTILVEDKNLKIQSGFKNKLEKSFIRNNEAEIVDYLLSLKNKFPKEETVIIKAQTKTSFQEVVSVVDLTKIHPIKKIPLFSKVVFQ